jgi:serine/threonine protein kinase/tetratricopeptide (TPR) repeat protein
VSQSPQMGSGGGPPAAARHVDEVCDRFEAAWLAGQQPCVKEYLGEVSVPERSDLFHELLKLDLHYRRQKLETPTEAEYCQPFPEYIDLIHAVFREEAALREQPSASADSSLPFEEETGPEWAGAVSAESPAHLGRYRITATLGSGTLPGHSPEPEKSWIFPADRYRILGEIARGGMGVVLRAYDVTFGRPLAIKLLLQYEGLPCPDERRLLEEARITGQLQHPGIPPAHELGRLADGRPFFSMKLIEGRTLASLLAERVGPNADLTRFLKIFEQIAQTLAYAHDQGVIHRDLKPSNIMVGAFGEVQVMDWGLARRLRGGEAGAQSGPATLAPGTGAEPVTFELMPAADPSAETPSAPLEPTAVMPHTTLPDSERLTQDGQVIGTPAFLSPEQARGAIDSLDERADVFGLGAILCVILTGEPPYRGHDKFSVIRRAADADLEDAFARLQSCGADAELIALCQVCLQAQKSERPAHAGIVAQVLTAYLASVQERLEQARVERGAVEVQAREERKRRRLAVSLALAIVVLVSGGVGVGLWHARDQASREAETRARSDYLEREVADAATEAEDRRQELHRCLQDEREAAQLQSDPKQWQRLLESAQAAYKRANVLAGGDRGMLSPALGEQLVTLAGPLEMDEQDWRLALALDRIRLESSVLVSAEVRVVPIAANLARVFRDAGYDLGQDSPDALANRIRQSAIRLPLVAALDFWASSVEDPELRGQLLHVARAADPHAWRDRFRQVEVWRDLNRLRALAAEVDCGRQTPQLLLALGRCLGATGGDPTGLIRRALIQHPRDFWLYFELGLASKNHAEQAGAFRAALAVRPDAAVAHYNLGVIQQGERYVDEAIACYQKTIDLEPKQSNAFNNLGLLLEEQNKPAEAIACYRKAIDNDPKYVTALLNLGSALQAQGNLTEAVSYYERALEIDPNNSAGLNNLGTALRLQDKLDEAVVRFQKAIHIDPNHAMAWCNLAHVLRQQEKFKQALPAMRRGHELGSRQSGWSYPSGFWVLETERWIALDEKLAALTRGEAVAGSAGEQLALAEFCAVQKKRYATAARYYAGAFAAEPKLAEQLSTAHRYDAACAAAQAASGEGKDAAGLDEPQRRRWRTQALEWLTAELAAWTTHIEKNPQSGPSLVKTLRHWQADTDLACIRDEPALAGLPIEERSAWRQFWARVAALAARGEKATARPSWFNSQVKSKLFQPGSSVQPLRPEKKDKKRGGSSI